MVESGVNVSLYAVGDGEWRIISTSKGFSYLYALRKALRALGPCAMVNDQKGKPSIWNLESALLIAISNSLIRNYENKIINKSKIQNSSEN